MRNVSRLRQEPMIAFGVPVLGGAVVPMTGQAWWVDPNAAIHTPKHAFGHGKSEDYPLQTLAEAESSSNTGDVIFIQGNIREENVIFDNLKFDRKVVGIGGLHHPDQPSSAYHPGSAMIRPPSSPTATTPLIVLRGRGTQFHNVVFDCPVDDTAVEIVENGSSGTDEYAGSHAVFRNVLFRQGQYGVELNGAGHNILWDGCEFFLMNNAGETGAGIIQTSTSVALGFKNTVRNCIFSPTSSIGGNDRHIVAAWQSSTIKHCEFGTVENTGRYIDLNGGNDNTVTKNTLGGLYATSDYRAGTSDVWFGNFADDAEATSDGITLTVPAA